MRKATLLFLGIIISISGLVACSSSAASDTGVFSDLVINIPWADGEQLSYRLDDVAGKTVGKVVFSIERDGDVYLLGRNYTRDNARVDSLVVVDRKTLAPIASSQILSSASAGTTELDCNYEQNRVTVIIPVGYATEESEEMEIKAGTAVIAVPDVIYDNDEIVFLGRTLPLWPGYSVEFPSFVAAQLSTPVVSLSVMGQEAVTTPAGTFECYKVRVGGIGEDSIQSDVWLWYGVAGTHPLVKYLSDSGSYILIG